MTSAAAAAAAAPSPAAFFFFPETSAWVSPSKSRLALSRPVDTGDPNAERPTAGVAGDATVSERIFSPTMDTMDGVFAACSLVSTPFFSPSSAPPAGTEPGTETGLKPYALERRFLRARSFPSPFFARTVVVKTVVVAVTGAGDDKDVVGNTQSKHRLHDAA
jgi:hypothetical protein